MGRRSFKKVTVYDTVTLHHRYLYYLGTVDELTSLAHTSN